MSIFVQFDGTWFVLSENLTWMLVWSFMSCFLFFSSVSRHFIACKITNNTAKQEAINDILVSNKPWLDTVSYWKLYWSKPNLVGIKSYSLKVLDRSVMDDDFSFKGSINRECVRNVFAVLSTISMLSCFLIFFWQISVLLMFPKLTKAVWMNGIKGNIHLSFGVNSPSRGGILQNLFKSLSTGCCCFLWWVYVGFPCKN